MGCHFHAAERIRQYEEYLKSNEKNKIESIDLEIAELQKRIKEIGIRQEEIKEEFLKRIG